LNPSGIRVAGIRMIPVVGGKYKVWTKRMGSGPVKVLLLHGGPGFPHACRNSHGWWQCHVSRNC
jgi:proline iminopeptidase